ncbi:MAG: NACHT domain-containing NTPase, partial [Scytonema sp. PMC 1069.18]|nr:NACHT domain-containing NTPase [Scytonema sp. PMC 1069.18]
MSIPWSFEVREKVKLDIKKRYGMMQVLDMSQPIRLNDIYTDVDILEKITANKWLEIPELLQNIDPEGPDRFRRNRVIEKRVPGLQAVEQHSKLMVLGKPGAGKTTFLKYLAIQCIEGHFQSDACGKPLSRLRFPIFITLRDFAEKSGEISILEYISLQLSDLDLANASEKAKQLLKQGKALVLLDGLDEVREEDTNRVLKQAQEFSYRFNSNQFVITCRIAAQKYTFQGFTKVEVADFNDEQIATFAQNWFRLKDSVKGKRFIEKLDENKPIKELAMNPLLLTLLCWIFGQKGDFPANRSELYTEGVDVLLKKWDATRNIERDRVYKDLSLQRKEDLLSEIALKTFEQKDYFFKKKTVEAYIIDFISNLRNASTEQKELELDSEAVLKSIEAQHGLLVARATGIYSFSHLTFQEYFTAREIVANSAWGRLVEHITQKRWREVFFLTSGMMRKADDLLKSMKQKIDTILEYDEKLQQFLTWVEEKSKSVEVPYKPAAVRAFYWTLEQILIIDYNKQTQNIYTDGCWFREFQLAGNIDEAIDYYLTLDYDIDCAQELDGEIQIIEDYCFNQKIENQVFPELENQYQTEEES